MLAVVVLVVLAIDEPLERGVKRVLRVVRGGRA